MNKADYDNSKYSANLADRIFLKKLSDCTLFPKYITIGTTNVCNANCKMCPHNAQVPGVMMKDELFDKIVDEISGYADWIEMVNLYWYGEPLLDITLAEKIKKLRGIGIKHIQISTNVERLTPDKVRELLGAGLNDLRLSVDAIHKESYEKIRIGLDFEKVMKNAISALEIRNNEFPNVPIRIRCVEQDENRGQSEEYKAFWLKYASEKDMIQVMPQIENVEWTGNHTQSASIEVEPCISVFSTIVIDADGCVPLCCMDVNKENPLGDLSKQSISDIWHSSLMNNIRLHHLAGRGYNVPICINCNGWKRL